MITNNMTTKVLVVGSVAFDAIETPFGKVDKTLGGAGTYISLSLAALGVPCAVVSVIGEDFGKKNLDMLVSKGIDVSAIETIEGGKTFFWSGKYHNDLNSRDTLITELNVLENFQPKVPAAYADSGIVILGNLHPAVQLQVLDQIKNEEAFTLLDTMNFWMNTTPELLAEVIKRVKAISINDEEARQLSGEYSLVCAAKKIFDMGPQYVIIKKGEHGALLFNGQEIFAVPGMPLEEVFDPTGAGDSFAGGFSAYLALKGKIDFEHMKSALIAGSAIASITVEKFGTESLCKVNKDSVRDRIEAFKKLTSFNIHLAS